ncbi:U3 small nucleolar RNA-associated protein 21 [Sphaceloma murrayae]|uniref:U3 small nucleolar RNA-associated protein 21 n=1 Tax=Sphaceloma murrayae TaxID=2082308 RepID=A0A2K1QMR1_9PEZI|nr:U3 small nucleolar RNA-associated protein 21 [Sphaceloma murrayae]
MRISKIIIVGAGPSGLLLALLLAKQGVQVELLEAAPELDTSPRATHYSWPAVYELIRAGIIDKVRERGFVITEGITWRKLDGTEIAKFNIDGIPYEQRMHCLPLGRLCGVLQEALTELPNAKISYSHRVLEIENLSEKAKLLVETPSGQKSMEADYVVGCDGANSQIRRALFGNDFPGFTWDEQIVATNVYYDLAKHGWSTGGFLVDPEHWSMATPIQPDGLLRVTYGEKPGLSHEEYKARQPDKFRIILPGHPSPGDYKLVNFSPYKIHQRCAEKFRVGRFLLAADAAHLCNPFGGLGLTGGIVDVGNLYDCLIGIHRGLADESILDRYSEVRREKYLTFTDPISRSNIKRLMLDPDVAIRDDDFFQMAPKLQDPVFAAKVSEGINGIMYDFTTEYRKTAVS